MANTVNTRSLPKNWQPNLQSARKFKSVRKNEVHPRTLPLPQSIDLEQLEAQPEKPFFAQGGEKSPKIRVTFATESVRGGAADIVDRWQLVNDRCGDFPAAPLGSIG